MFCNYSNRMLIKPSWVFALGFNTTNVFSTAGFSLGICRVLGFCPGVTGFGYILVL